MNIYDFLAELKELGVKVHVEDGDLKLEAPKGAVTPQLVARIKENKQELIQAIQTITQRSRKTTIPKIAESETYKVSHSQKRFWISEMMERTENTYVISGAFELQGDLDIEKLQQSFHGLVERHEILRTIFGQDATDNLYQKVLPFQPEAYQITVSDFTTSENATAKAEELINAALQQQFQLEKLPLIRLGVCKIEASRWQLYFSMHHIISDGWSMSVLINELTQGYQDAQWFQKEKALDIQYKEYAAWQQNLLASEKMKAYGTFWKEAFSELPAPLQLPTQKVPPKYPSNAGKIHSAQLPIAEVARLKDYAKTKKVSLFSLLLSTVTTLVYRYTSQREFIIGTPVLGRNHAELKNQIGPYINLVPLKINVHSEVSFSENFEEINNNLQQALAYQEYPYDLIVEAAKSKHNERASLIDMMVSFTEEFNTSDTEATFGDNIHIAPIAHEHTASRFNMTCNFIQRADEIYLNIEYRTELFDEAFIEQFSHSFIAYLEAILDDETSEIYNIDYVENHEKEIAKEDQRDKILLEILQQQVVNTPDAIAVSHKKQTLSYSELWEKSLRFAYYLKTEKNVQKGDFVVLMLDHSVEAIYSFLGILAVGAVYVPVALGTPADRLQLISEDCNAKAILTKEDISAIDHQEVITSNEFEKVAQEDTAYLIYTSGSSGIPKGVLASHKNISAHIRVIQEEIIPFATDIKMLQHASYAFDISLFEIITGLVSGGEIVITSGFDIFDPEIHTETLAKVTHIEGVPSFFDQLIKSVAPEDRAVAFKNIEQVYIGGDAVTTQHLINLEKWFPNVTVNELYGPTEATMWCAKKTYAKDPDNSKLFKGSVIGQAVGGHELMILDEYLKKVPTWVAGEIHIGGEGVAKGYLNRMELTEKHFIQNPFNANEILYKTGDMARRLPNGDIEFLERKDNQVKVNGYRIELGEIEQQLFGTDSVEEVAIIIHENENGQKEIAAYFTASKTVELSEVRTHLQRKLPGFMVPNHIQQLEAMPLTPNGKIDKKAFKLVNQVVENIYKAPTTDKEATLIKVWQDVLRKDRIGILDNFYNLGGDSIKSIQIASRVKEYGYQIKITDVLSNPIVEEQAALLEALNVTIDQSAIVGDMPLTPIQAYFFSKTLNANQLTQSVLLEATENIDTNLLKQSIEKAVQHHDVLRAHFYKNETTWQAKNNEITGEDFDFTTYDVNGEENAFDPLQTIVDEIQSSFQVEEGNLLKVAHINIENVEFVFLAAHHLIIDTFSWRILIEDITTGYQQLKAGKNIELPLKTDAYQKWAMALPESVAKGKFATEIDYWKQICQQEIPAFPTLNADHTARFNTKLTCALSKDHTLQLQTKVHQRYNTEINDILLTALGLAIKEVIGIDKTMLKMESHGREDIIPNLDISRTIGWFTSIYPFVLDVSQHADALNNVISVKEALRKIPNKGIGYGMLKYLSADLQEEFTPSITFNYLGDIGGETSSETTPLFQLSDQKVSIAQAGEIEDCILNVSGLTAEDQLSLSVEYDATMFEETTMMELRDALESNLINIIETFSNATDKSITPSDLTFKGTSMSWLQQYNVDNNIEDVYRLSPLQEGIYYHWLSSDNNALYFEQMTYRLEGDINLEYIETAFKQLIERHAVLRTSFTNSIDNELLQIVWKTIPHQFEIHRLEEFEGDKEAQVLHLKEQDRQKGFNLEQTSQIRLQVLVLGANEYEFIWGHHHILSDGWCMSILLNDFNALLRGLYENKKVTLPKPVPFVTYIQWLERINKKASIAYWENYLAGYEKVIKIPADHTLKEKKQSIRAKKITIPQNLFEKVQQCCESLSITENSFMQTAWGYLLSKYNDTKDAVFGTIVSGRPGEIRGVENIIGLFINTIPVRIQYDENESLQDVLQKTHKNAIEGTSHHYLSVTDVQAQTPFGSKLINHLFVYDNYPIQETVAANEEKERTRVKAVEVFEQTNYDFTINITPTSNGLDIDFKYNDHVYEAETIARLGNHLLQIVTSFCTNMQAELSSIAYITEVEKHQLLHDFNNTATDFHIQQTIIDAFEVQAAKTPEAIAIIENSRRRTYAELNQTATKYASYLHQELGIKENDTVVVSLPQSFELIAVLLGVKKLGATVVPVDVGTTSERINYIKENSNCNAFITEENLQNMGSFSGEIKLPQRTNSVESHTEFILYTSGSTGKPKGVKLGTKSIMNRFEWMWNAYPFAAHEVCCAKTSISFVDHIWEIYGPLLQGIPVVMYAKAQILDVANWMQSLHDEKVTRMVLVPSLLKELLAYPELCQEKLHQLQLWISSGEKLQTELIQEFYDVFNDESTQLLNIYGSTEITADATYFDTRSMIETLNASKEIITDVPIGKPIANTKVYILDEHLKPVSVGVTGELFVGGASVSQGYIQKENEAANRFISNPFVAGEIIFKTGDFGKWNQNGEVIFTGRKDYQVKIRGQRVELTEIEQILQQYDGITHAVTLIKDEVLAAFYVTSKTLDLSELRTHCKKYLPEYMIPVHFMELEELPLTINGKVDRKAIADIEIVSQVVEENQALPETEIEKKVALIWQEVLGIPSIAIDDNFFEIGGHSLHAIKILTLVNKEFEIALTMKKVLSLVTIKEFAGYINFVITQREMKLNQDELTEIEL